MSLTTFSPGLEKLCLDTPNTGLDPGLDPGVSTIQGKGLQDLQDLTPNILENCQIQKKS